MLRRAHLRPGLAGSGRDIVRSAFSLAHNASFDRRCSLACCRAAGLPAPEAPFLHPERFAAQPAPAVQKLNLVCEYFGIALNHHNAASDAQACAEVYLRLRGLGVTDAQMRL